MSRRMSCSLTVDAVRARTKTVTRRSVDTWWMLKPGDRLTLIEKAQGLEKGERQVVLAEVKVVDVRVEPLGWITPEDIEREGFRRPQTCDEWVAWWAKEHGYAQSWDKSAVPVRRIEWVYLDHQPEARA